jgi:hypothetical protein
MKEISLCQEANDCKTMEISYEHKSCSNCSLGRLNGLGCLPAISKECGFKFINWEPDEETKLRGGIK